MVDLYVSHGGREDHRLVVPVEDAEVTVSFSKQPPPEAIRSIERILFDTEKAHQ